MMTYIFTPYTSVPKTTDKFVITTSKGGYSHCIDRNGKGYTLPNCVAFVHAMWLKTLTSALGLEEAKKIEAKMCRNNAEVYWGYKDGFARGQSPKLGAIMVWEGKGSLAGHVMTVTEVKSNGDVVCTGSDYSGSKFYQKTYYKSKGYNFSSSYIFKGFIYTPIEFAYTVGKPVARDVYKDQVKVTATMLRARADAGLTADCMGYINPGIYNIEERKSVSGYSWVRVDSEHWIAVHNEDLNTDLAEVLPKVEVKYNISITGMAKDQLADIKDYCLQNGLEYTVFD